ncbi:glycoside hydrolase family 19 protein [Rosenbergiella epipactidis]|uniref:glycoside hydrolase family 19 protein n=1 Tax=Rosenbergiella epipactidis TaxID=1544694 RepID=UPI001BD976E4|nr:glycoside hydrolase family 19 protein [Rosenbergiella epipactidis]MBT0718129.1 glycoside hydrolase family 19 protein [Rosenbergiella epipactidis]
MNLQQFQKAANISAGLATRWFQPITDAMAEFGITAGNDKAMFIAQVGHESGGFTALKESFNYTPAALLTTFGSRITNQQAYALGRSTGKPANQEAIANLVYYNRMGNKSRDDGWKYRGRGLIQITGLENYAKCGAGIKADLLSEPQLLESDINAARSAAWFFTSKSCTLYSGDIERVTLIINGGRNGLDDRKSRFNIAKSVLA